MTDKDIAILFANKIKEKIDRALSLCNMPYVVDSNEEKFELIKSLSSLVSELLDKDNLKEKLLNLANTSTVNGSDNEIKIETFDFIRNILAHNQFSRKTGPGCIDTIQKEFNDSSGILIEQTTIKKKNKEILLIKGFKSEDRITCYNYNRMV